MMSLLLATALLYTVESTDDTISVHEWGAVLYTAGSTVATGSPAYDPLGSICVDAPVLYFHGPAFTGDVTVCSLGRIFSTYPEPDEAGGPMLDLGGLGSAIRWMDISVSTEDGILTVDRRSVDDVLIPGFDWALPLWRVPRSSWISRARDSFCDRFLYYEVDLSGVGFPLPLPEYASEGATEEEIFTGDALVFRRLNGFVTCMPMTGEGMVVCDESDRPAIVDKSGETAVAAIRQWAGAILTEDEIQAMWATWEPYVLYGDWQGDSLVVFPVPQPLVERISTIIVTPDSGIPVSCSRFFLGMSD